MPAATAKRTSYSFFDVPSLYSRERVRVPTRALERLLIELETTPGVIDCQFANKEVPVFIGHNEDVAVLNFLVTRKTDSRPNALCVQLVPGSRSQAEFIKVQAGLDYCERNGLEHLVANEGRPAAGRFELQNRNAAHAWLTRAWAWPSQPYEYDLMRQLQAGPLWLSEVSRLLELTDLQTRVVFLRCWLRGLVHWDVGNDNILRDLMVEEVRRA